MKNINRFGWLAAVVLLAAACSDDDPIPQPEPKLELKSVIAWKYWVSDSSFTYITDGIEKVDTITSLQDLRADMGLAFYPDLYLGVFHCSEDGTAIDKYYVTPYTGDSEGEKLLVYRGLYSLFLNPNANTIRLSANDPETAGRNIYEGMTLRLRSLAEDRVEFDMDINEFVRKDWAPILDEAVAPITGIRVVWKSLTEEKAAEYHDFQDPIVVFPE